MDYKISLVLPLYLITLVSLLTPQPVEAGWLRSWFGRGKIIRSWGSRQNYRRYQRYHRNQGQNFSHRRHTPDSIPHHSNPHHSRQHERDDSHTPNPQHRQGERQPDSHHESDQTTLHHARSIGHSNGGNTYATDLVPAGKNGNPAFQFRLHAGNPWTCQATLVAHDKEKDTCVAATAAHCVKVQGMKYDPKMDADTYTLPISGANFKKAYAKLYIDRRWDPPWVRVWNRFRGWISSRATGPHDVATMVFRCDDDIKIPIAKPAKTPPRHGENLFYGLVVNNQGLYPRKAWSQKNGTMAALSRISRYPFSANGDSGGGLYRVRDGQMELVGLHSGWLNYATSLNIIHKTLDHFIGGSSGSSSSPSNSSIASSPKPSSDVASSSPSSSAIASSSKPASHFRSFLGPATPLDDSFFTL